MPSDPQNFWNFSLQLYDRPGVASACLELQDAHRLDVNLLLFCFWHASAYGTVDRELLQKVVAFSSEWRTHLVQPLRSTRQWMKLNSSSDKQFDDLREQIKASELMGEKLQQEKIASLTSAFWQEREYQLSHEDIDRNIDRLLQALGIERIDAINSRLRAIRGAV
ncbi:MAG: hypothetical protein DHS20C12_21530 [Pseudohongiella sp.]|nr:MAG: hypothetical protein DHS20C12_21530 [Pseudohongiella sp.]